MDIFESKNIKPMLIDEMQQAFDSPDYIYELKLDGIRCIVYLDKSGVELRNKRNLRVSEIYPELKDINKQVKKRCILDGELVVMREGKPDFQEIQRRSLMTNKFRIELAASKLPISFIAYDIIYIEDRQITDLPLIERKVLLQKTVKENERLAVSRYIEEKGIELYALTVQQDLEGIVAKRIESKYYFGKKTKDWIKIKYLKDEDFVICGYAEKENHLLVIYIAQYRDNKLIYKGYVTMPNRQDYITIVSTNSVRTPEFLVSKESADTTWIEPKLVCTVQFMQKNETGGLRQPVYKGLRNDKSPHECIEPN